MSTSPIRCESGRKASSNTTSLKSWPPVKLMIGRMVIPGDLHLDQELGQPVPAVLLGRGRGAQQRDHVIGFVRVRGPDLAPVDQPAAIGLGRPRRGGEHVGARIGLGEADAEAQLAGGDPRQDLSAGSPPGRSAGSPGPIGGRRSSGRGSARAPPASPRSPHSVRAASARGRRISWARSCRSSPWRRALRLNSRENPPLPRCGEKVPASASAARKARTSWRNSAASGGSSTGSKRKLVVIDASRSWGLTSVAGGLCVSGDKGPEPVGALGGDHAGRAASPTPPRCRTPRATPTAGASHDAACARR